MFFQAQTYFIAPIILSFIALNFLRKNGVRVRRSLSSRQSAHSEELYFDDLLLENLKDRPINILNIYIRGKKKGVKSLCARKSLVSWKGISRKEISRNTKLISRG